MRKTYRSGAAAAVCAFSALVAPAAVTGHGAAGERYETTILSVEPAGLPVDVRMSDDDEIRFENQGDEDLLICGYEEAEDCAPWVRIGEAGVFEDRNAEAWYANSEGDEQGEVPEGAGDEPDFVKVRSEPPFYQYHDHRVHWMGGESLPPNVDEFSSEPQEVFTGTVNFRYGDTPGSVTARLDYVGGASYVQRYGEYALVGAAVLAMLLFFVVDARRRRRRPAVEAPAGSADAQDAQAP